MDGGNVINTALVVATVGLILVSAGLAGIHRLVLGIST